MIGPINLGAKQAGERNSGKSASCVRRGGGWKRGMVEMVRRSQPKGRANGEHKHRPKPARQSSTLPTWRGLETWHGRDAVTPRNRKGEATVNTNFDLNRRASLRPYLGAPGGEIPPGDSTIAA